MQRLRDFAENEFLKIFDVYTKEIYTPEAKQAYYTKPAETSDTPPLSLFRGYCPYPLTH
jgi:hypothetical protein